MPKENVAGAAEAEPKLKAAPVEAAAAGAPKVNPPAAAAGAVLPEPNAADVPPPKPPLPNEKPDMLVKEWQWCGAVRVQSDTRGVGDSELQQRGDGGGGRDGRDLTDWP